ncbi:N-acyl homoserine lactonase family protein [Sphingomonas gilva]|uniref:N-acyl homoserine lactonase family protein n=1 Tax=Sphingomonas gilva TaxID=2305907 RepID=A0A396RQ22_9SPHN|nr:N-acyl homoserine lactonase family protein [Sphingomonas gilva]RHW17402.1 N-acyl homoserine lactonase family protein [Sphingomonas gilva]
MRRALFVLVAGTIVSGVAAFAASEPAARVTLTRLDCGTVAANDLNQFSDTDAYVGKSKNLASSCYLIRHGDDLMIWDTGLPAAIKGKPIDPKLPMDATVTTTLVEQLAQLNIKPEQIGRVGISHFHFDHIGQASSFPGATLLIGAADWNELSAKTPDKRLNPDAVRHWISGGGKVEPVQGDRDVFGDGSVRMIDLPGHTPGHHGLMVKLKNKGDVLLTGDQAHFTENYESEGVPSFNTDRADTLASFKRFKDMAKNANATVIIQHEPADIAKLPAFPQAAD